MKGRPILFSAPMVRALLSGTKTQTRRIVKAHAAKNGEGLGEYLERLVLADLGGKADQQAEGQHGGREA